MSVPFSIIVAMDEKCGIGKEGTLPWKLSADLKHFKTITTQGEDGKMNVVIMGRKTWESLPDGYKPLPGRINVVVSRNDHLTVPRGAYRVSSLEGAFDIIESSLAGAADKIFVIGGAQIFAEAIQSPACQNVYLTKIYGDFSCDTVFPLNLQKFGLVSESLVAQEGDLKYSFHEYTRNLS